MIRPLNPEALKPPRVPTKPTTAPQVEYMDLYGQPVAYDANSMAALLLDVESWQRAREDDDELRGLLYSDRMPQFRCFPRSPLRHLVLNVTHACNLACRYCFAESYRDAASMPAGVIDKALALFAPPRSDGERRHPIHVSFFGGEPLLAWRSVVHAVDVARRLAQEQGRASACHVTTNGVALDDAKAACIAEHGMSTLVSLDGPEAIHNSARPMRTKGNSWQLTINALNRLKDAGAALPMVRGTYTLDSPRMMERVEFYGRLMDVGLISGFSLEPAAVTEGCARREAAPVDTAQLGAEYHQAAQWYIGRLKAGKEPGFMHLRKLTARLLNAVPQGTECGAGNGYLTVGPDGAVYACHRETGTRIGHVDYGIDEAARCPWADNRIYGRQGCMECWARYVCGGGCRQHAAELGRPLNRPNENACAIMRIVVREALWILTQA